MKEKKKAGFVSFFNKEKNKERMQFIKKLPKKDQMFFSICLIIAVLLAVLALQKLSKDRDLDLSYAYGENYALSLEGVSSFRKAEPFAAKLCVTDGNVGMENVSMTNNEKACLLDVDNSKVLFAQNIHKKAYPASITKIMTAIVAIENSDLEDVVTISAEDVDLEKNSQLCGFQPGDMVSMDELLHGLLVYSGNDAAMAIAEHVGGSVDHFVEMMNEKALELGCTETHFMNPHGLHNEDHYTTAYDIYLMLNKALSYDYFIETMQLPVYNMSIQRGGETVQIHLDATDHYLTGEVHAPSGVTVLGGKTGTTSAAGACLAILSQNKYGAPYISIVLKASTKARLYDDMNQLLEKINDNY